jgi:poly-gamma-glutamate synthase PgsB/CapB
VENETKVLLTAALSLGVLLVYFFGEYLFFNRVRRKIPLRICVTGTRGKSGVTRLIAASLREAGYRTLAKTTGSKPVLILPDGEEEEIRRRGMASILEQKKILRLASRLGVQALVIELMSIQGECLSVESGKMLKPGVLAITNVRLDHLDLMGTTLKETADALASAIAPRSTVFILEEESYPGFAEQAKKVGAWVVWVPKDAPGRDLVRTASLPFEEFEENIRLALAVPGFVGVEREVSLRGMLKARPDFGNLGLWKIPSGSPPLSHYAVNAFAANDPESTFNALAKIKKRIPWAEKKIVGLLNLREDRGDRTLQWLKTLKEMNRREFDELAFAGYYPHALSLKRRLRDLAGVKVFAYSETDPEALMKRLIPEDGREAVVIGMGNMGGLGRALVEHWEKIGNPYGH